MADSIGRSWQLGTVQLDYSMPERFELAYTGADNAEHRPVMIHRALLGSFERFIGILIEHYAGELPLWLAPVQAIVLPVSDRFNEYGASVRERLREQGLRVELDDRGESIGRKVRDAELRRIPRCSWSASASSARARCRCASTGLETRAAHRWMRSPARSCGRARGVLLEICPCVPPTPRYTRPS